MAKETFTYLESMVEFQDKKINEILTRIKNIQ
jgi:hypothetical protein